MTVGLLHLGAGNTATNHIDTHYTNGWLADELSSQEAPQERIMHLATGSAEACAPSIQLYSS